MATAPSKSVAERAQAWLSALERWFEPLREDAVRSTQQEPPSMDRGESHWRQDKLTRAVESALATIREVAAKDNPSTADSAAALEIAYTMSERRDLLALDLDRERDEAQDLVPVLTKPLVRRGVLNEFEARGIAAACHIDSPDPAPEIGPLLRGKLRPPAAPTSVTSLVRGMADAARRETRPGTARATVPRRVAPGAS